MGDLAHPILVARNATVRMVLSAGAIALSAEGIALEEGAMGAHIRVQNPSSHAIVLAEITGADDVPRHGQSHAGSGGRAMSAHCRARSGACAPWSPAEDEALAPYMWMQRRSPPADVVCQPVERLRDGAPDGACTHLVTRIEDARDRSVMARMRKPTLLLLMATLSGCATLQRLSEIGRPPPMTVSSDPTADPHFRPISMPMPHVVPSPAQAGSLWQGGSRAFFKDQRAAQVGDIVTVLVNTTDTADVENASTETRQGSESMGVPNLFGLEAALPKLLAKAVNPSNLVTATSAGSAGGTGVIKRNETVMLRLAGVITQVLPNGNLVVAARAGDAGQQRAARIARQRRHPAAGYCQRQHGAA